MTHGRLSFNVAFTAAILSIAVAWRPCLADANAAAATTTASTVEAVPPSLAIVKLEANPASIELVNRFDYRQVLLTGITEAGDRVDVTRIAKLESAGDSKFAEVSASGLVRAAADGGGAIKYTVGDSSVEIPVKVTGYGADYNASFVRDVMPLISKLGCNAGTCHGAAQGQERLQAVAARLRRAVRPPGADRRPGGRRFNRAAPEQSLMLLKPAGGVPHVGGVLTKPGEPYYELLRSGSRKGVKLDLETPARQQDRGAARRTRSSALPGMKQQIAVLATYSRRQRARRDGARRSSRAATSRSPRRTRRGVVTALRRGEAPVLVRYEGAYAATTVTVMGDRTGFAWEEQPEYNYIDELVYEKLKKVKIAAERAVHRRRVRPPRLPRPDRPAADGRAGAGVPGRRARDASEARRAGRSAGRQRRVRRALDEQVGRPVAGEPQVPRRGGGEGVPQLDPARPSPTNMPYDQFAHADADGERARTWRTRRRRTTRCSRDPTA